MRDYTAEIEQYEKAHKNIAIAYGGDGEVLNVVKRTEGKKAVIPFRNYGLCDKHATRFDDFLFGKDGQKDLKMQRCPFIQWEMKKDGKELSGRGIAEIVFKSADITKALRFNVYVNGSLYLKNVICDAGLISTRYGSTGYFKSVSRCIFNSDSIGVAFVAPTQGISNLVLSNTCNVTFEFVRDAKAVVSADVTTTEVDIAVGDRIEVREIPDAVSMFGLREFHCYSCRQKRHSVVEAGVSLQDQYTIL